MTKIIKLSFLTMSFSLFHHANTLAADFSIEKAQENAKWAMTLDEEQKPLGIYSSFMLLEPADKDKILRIRFNVCPSDPTIANLFSQERYENNSRIALMQSSSIALGVVAVNESEINKAKEIIYSINNQYQAEHDVRIEQAIAKNTAVDKSSHIFNWRKSLKPILPFTLLNYEQPNCFMAAVDFTNYKFLGTFIEQLQIVYPELKSKLLDEGYQMFAERIELANRTSTTNSK